MFNARMAMEKVEAHRKAAAEEEKQKAQEVVESILFHVDRASTLGQTRYSFKVPVGIRMERVIDQLMALEFQVTGYGKGCRIIDVHWGHIAL